MPRLFLELFEKFLCGKHLSHEMTCFRALIQVPNSDEQSLCTLSCELKVLSNTITGNKVSCALFWPQLVQAPDHGESALLNQNAECSSSDIRDMSDKLSRAFHVACAHEDDSLGGVLLALLHNASASASAAPSWDAVRLSGVGLVKLAVLFAFSKLL